MIKLNVTYPELCFLRKILQDEKTKIWRGQYLPNMKKKTKKDILEIYDKVMNKDRSIWTAQGVCNNVLENIAKIEEKLQRAIKEGKK